MKRRWSKKRPRNSNKQWLPYKNEFEYNLGQILPAYSYESKKLDYIIQAKYNPDFISKAHDWLYIEAKGYFIGGSTEARKYIWVKRSNPEIELLFIFANPNKKAYSSCRIRKDGSMLTMGEWAAKNGFAFVSHDKVPKILGDGNIDKGWIDDLKDRQFKYYFNKERKK